MRRLAFRCALALSPCLILICLGPATLHAQLFPTTVGQNFEGTAAGITSLAADTMGAVGIDHFVELNNEEFRVYQKNNGAPVLTKTIDQFWVDANTSPLSIPFDPRVVYDSHARRWYAVAVDDRVSANNFLFAVSDSADPTGSWSGFSIDSDADDSNWADFPMLSYNAQGVFISTNMPQLSAPQTRTAFVAFPKIDLLQPTPSIANHVLFQDVSGATTGFSPQLAIDDSLNFGRDIEIISQFNVGAGLLQRSLINGPPGVPQLLSGGQINLPVAANPPTVVQPGAPAVQNLMANDARFSGNAVLRGNELYAVQSIDDGGRAATRYLRIDLTSNTVLESHVIGDSANRAHSFPSIAINQTGDLVIGFTATSSTEFASSYAMVGKVSGGVTQFDLPILLRAGVDNYERLDSQNRNRWGDYSATVVDPADPNIFWTNQEFVKNTNQWATQVSELIVPLPNEARWADPIAGPVDDPTLWQTSHGGPPLPLDHLVFSRAVDPGVTYAVDFPPAPPGTYTHELVSVRQGNVRLELNGNDWVVPLHLEIGPFQSNPDVTIAGGLVNSGAGFIAAGPTSEGYLTLDSAQWDTGGVVVGSPPANGATGLLPGAQGGVGSLVIDNNSQLNVGGALTVWEQGSVQLNSGTLSADTIEHLAPVAGTIHGLQVNGGTLEVNRFIGNLENAAGTLSPGMAVAGLQFATTDITGDYNQQSAASLLIDIADAAPGLFDILNVGGNAFMSGVLDINLVGYTPNAGDIFSIINAGFIPAASYLNLLSNSTLPSLGRLHEFHLFYDPAGLVLATMPSFTGDYNANGVVDAADYTVWRDSLGMTGPGLPADSNRDGIIDIVDYLAWRVNFGAIAPGSGSGNVPEPSAGWILLSVATISAMGRRNAFRG